MERTRSGEFDRVGQVFRDVDRAAAPQAAVSYLAWASQQRGIQALKGQIMKLLDPQPGMVALDMGCGRGDDVRAMAERVGPMGRVVGVDFSAAMIKAARGEPAGPDANVEYHQGDAHQIALPDNTFDVCRTERTLQHVADPARVVAELVRVAKPGGCIVAGEPDWDTLVVNGGDRRVTRVVVQARSDLVIRNGWIGRELPGTFNAAGLEELKIVAVGCLMEDLAQARRMFELDTVLNLAQEQGLLSRDQSVAWLHDLEAASRERKFFAGVFVVVCAGRKPRGND